MANVWKISTLVLAGALAVVVGKGVIAESSACDGGGAAVVDTPSPAEISRLRLARGLAFLERAEQELAAATAAPTKDRNAALAQIAKAKASVELALNPDPQPVMVPVPKPLPRKPVTNAGTRADVMDPFAKPEVVRASVKTTGADVMDPWAQKRRDPLSVRN